MDYVIKNHKEVYIKLSVNGRPETCKEHDKTLFEHSKAKNILDNLPKTLKRLNFRVEGIPDLAPKEKELNVEKESNPKRELHTISKYYAMD